MRYLLILVTVSAAWFFLCCHCQDMGEEELEAISLQTALKKIDDLNRKMEEINIKLEALKEIRNLKEEIQVCSSKEQVESFQELLTINECTSGSHKCHVDATCEDKVAGYVCQCLPGYSGDGFSCQDIDECKEGLHRCHDDANCINTEGNYTCSCRDGFSGDGLICEDVDECMDVELHGCDSKAICTNFVGSYNCACVTGYPGDGFECKGEPCMSPSKFIKDLGCITPVEESMTWEDARMNCQLNGMRLLEGITSQQQMDELQRHFGNLGDVWIGHKMRRWVKGGESIDLLSLWLFKFALGKPNETHCGELRMDRPGLGYYKCSTSENSLCQRE